ncbi:MAG: flagellar type III secretion system pore protein FliP [Fimbriimonadaceae bacterium]|nr:flagellar type III secretion system pore protein FliP [Fimbriimonadaceae bacterium]
MSGRALLRASFVLLLIGAAVAAFAQQGVRVPSINVDMGGKAGQPDDLSTPLQILALLTVLSIAPAILILTTAFTRIVIVLGFVRSALGTPNVPPNQVLIGLSLFLTFYVMGPTFETVHKTALEPYFAKKISSTEAFAKAEAPIKGFMLNNTYESDLALFVNLSRERPETRESVKLSAVIPAFVISELKTSFIIGFYIFIPFLIIDLIVASALMSMGMMMLPPVVVSLPAKLLVFVLADGWATLTNAIVSGYR